MISKRNKHRSTLQQCRDLISTVSQYPTFRISRLAAIAGINPAEAKTFFANLVMRGFLREKGANMFSVTQKGYEWQKQFTLLENAMEGELILIHS